MKPLLFALACGFALTCFGQNTRINDRNSIGWFNQFMTIQTGNKWSVHLEYQWRRENLVQTWQQSLFRTGINFQASKRLQLRAGYAYIETFPYGDFQLQAAGKRFPEHRLYQMLTLTDAVGRIDLSHRLMLEQRWVGRYSRPELNAPDDHSFLNRLRYQLRLQAPLNRRKMENGTAYLAAYNEVFIGFGKNVAENVFDQNRLGFLLGYRFNSNWRAEAGYLQQLLQLGREIDGRNVFQDNRGIILNTYLLLDL